MDRSLHQLVWQRAGGLCEYCQRPQDSSSCPFEIDHIVAEQHGGATDAGNLAVACIYCNRHKGPNLSGTDPETGRIVRLFNPRTDGWDEHFEWAGPVLHGRTDIGRATIVVLAINRPEYVDVRQELIDAGLFPPSRQ